MLCWCKCLCGCVAIGKRERELECYRGDVKRSTATASVVASNNGGSSGELLVRERPEEGAVSARVRNEIKEQALNIGDKKSVCVCV